MHIVLLKDLFSSISYIIFFVICRSAKEYAHGKVNEENAEANVLMFEPEQCLEIRNYKYSFNRNFIIFWQMKLVIFFFFFFSGGPILTRKLVRRTIFYVADSGWA